MRQLHALREAADQYGEMVREADRLGHQTPSPDPWDEVRTRFPVFLASLSPQARALIAEHAAHTAALCDAVGSVMRPHLRLVGHTVVDSVDETLEQTDSSLTVLSCQPVQNVIERDRTGTGAG